MWRIQIVSKSSWWQIWLQRHLKILGGAASECITTTRKSLIQPFLLIPVIFIGYTPGVLFFLMIIIGVENHPIWPSCSHYSRHLKIQKYKIISEAYQRRRAVRLALLRKRLVILRNLVLPISEREIDSDKEKEVQDRAMPTRILGK